MYDLPILLSVLAAAGLISRPPEDCAFFGELSLSGRLRPVRGALPMALAAERAGIRQLFVRRTTRRRRPSPARCR